MWCESNSDFMWSIWVTKNGKWKADSHQFLFHSNVCVCPLVPSSFCQLHSIHVLVSKTTFNGVAATVNIISNVLFQPLSCVQYRKRTSFIITAVGNAASVWRNNKENFENRKSKTISNSKNNEIRLLEI